ncbi:ribosomal protein rps23 [Cyclospora cayetanensis]|uniref:Ribosomal protein rps23 n=1 Tax=Cyclospora cayetanensis TaxID=88456 RepID=A0A1D3D0V4_9EIME|nr:ribosomal protein rps23 [Cyclospora cayetanensis]
MGCIRQRKAAAADRNTEVRRNITWALFEGAADYHACMRAADTVLALSVKITKRKRTRMMQSFRVPIELPRIADGAPRGNHLVRWLGCQGVPVCSGKVAESCSSDCCYSLYVELHRESDTACSAGLLPLQRFGGSGGSVGALHNEPLLPPQWCLQLQGKLRRSVSHSCQTPIRSTDSVLRCMLMLRIFVARRLILLTGVSRSRRCAAANRAADQCTRGKPRGMRTARKLRNRRRVQKWADKQYKKAHLGTRWKANPFGGSSHAKGIVVEKLGIEAKQPNSAIRKCVRVQLIKNGKRITAFVPGDGCLNYVDENDEVLVAGFGRSGHAVGDIPGVRFKIVKVSGVSLIALFKEKKEKPRRQGCRMRSSVNMEDPVAVETLPEGPFVDDCETRFQAVDVARGVLRDLAATRAAICALEKFAQVENKLTEVYKTAEDIESFTQRSDNQDGHRIFMVNELTTEGNKSSPNGAKMRPKKDARLRVGAVRQLHDLQEENIEDVGVLKTADEPYAKHERNSAQPGDTTSVTTAPPEGTGPEQAETPPPATQPWRPHFGILLVRLP